MRQPVDIPKDRWTLVAQNVTSGLIDVMTHDFYAYSFDYVLTGDASPTTDATAVVFHGRQEKIDNDQYIDVYVKCKYDGRVMVSI